MSVRWKAPENSRQRHVGLTITLAVIIGLAGGLPILYLVISSFDVSELGEPARWGVDGWVNAFARDANWRSIVTTVGLSVRAPIALIVSAMIAFWLVRADLPGRRFLEMLIWFGFLIPTVPMVMGWILLLDHNTGLLNRWITGLGISDGPLFSIYSFSGIVWVHITATTVPFLVILLTPAFRQFDEALEDAGRVSGAGKFMVISKITLPLLLPAFVTAFVATLIKSLETFEVEQIIGTPVGINVYANRIYDLMRFDPPLIAEAMALSTVFLVVLLVLLFVFRRTNASVLYSATVGGKGPQSAVRRRTYGTYFAATLIYAYVGFTIFLPLAALTAGTFTKLYGFFNLDDPWTINNWVTVLADPRFLSATLSSLWIGVAVGCVGILLYTFIAWPLVRMNVGAKNLLNLMIWLPWAVPGLVLGNVLLVMFLEVPVLSPFYGTVIPLIIGLVIKELPIGVQLIRVGLGQIKRELGEAGLVAGANQVLIVRRIILPLIAPTLVAAFLLIFAASVRDISTVVLLASPGTRTLSLLMFDFASSGELEAASVVGLIVAMICLAVTAIAFSISRKTGFGATSR
ncbi:MAG: iron ABC transporter permease [Hyphomicrobiales bacterium]